MSAVLAGTDDTRDDRPVVIALTGEDGGFRPMSREMAEIVCANMRNDQGISGLYCPGHGHRASEPEVHAILNNDGRVAGYGVVSNVDPAQSDHFVRVAQNVCAHLAQGSLKIAANARESADIIAQYAATGCPHYGGQYAALDRQAATSSAYAARLAAAAGFGPVLPGGFQIGWSVSANTNG